MVTNIIDISQVNMEGLIREKEAMKLLKVGNRKQCNDIKNYKKRLVGVTRRIKAEKKKRTRKTVEKKRVQ